MGKPEGLVKGGDLAPNDRVRLVRQNVEVTVLGPRPADEGWPAGWWAESDDGRSWRLYSDDEYLVIGTEES